VLIGASLTHAGHGLLTKLLALPMFIVGVALATAFVRRCERSGRQAVAPLLIAQIVLLGGFALVGWLAMPVVDADAWRAVCAGLLGVAAMAVQNAASRLVFTSLSPTTVMTGNVTQVVIDAVDLWRARSVDGAAARARIRKMWPPVLAFALGAIAGAMLFIQIGFACLLLPMLALAVVVKLSQTPGMQP
jgi:uncharacterized membrane protein YoaK (UPF0700 family)